MGQSIQFISMKISKTSIFNNITNKGCKTLINTRFNLENVFLKK